MIALAALMHPVVVLAAETAEKAAETESAWGPSVWGLPAVVWHVINFAIFAAIVYWGAKKLVVDGAQAKRDRIRKEIEEATKLRDEMRTKFQEYDSRMQNIDARMNELLQDARTQAEAEKARILGEAEAAAKRMREEAKVIADQEIARAKHELQEEQIARAAELAEQVLRANVNKDDQARLSQEFLTRIDGGSSAGKQKPA